MPAPMAHDDPPLHELPDKELLALLVDPATIDGHSAREALRRMRGEPWRAPGQPWHPENGGC